MTRLYPGQGICNDYITDNYIKHAGTLGGVVYDERGEVNLLTCFHCVYAPGFEWDSGIISPSNPFAKIGTNSSFIKAARVIKVMRNPFVDIALLKPMEGFDIQPLIGDWQPKASRELSPDEAQQTYLKKYGFASNKTYGRFEGFHPSYGDRYGEVSMYYLHDLIRIHSPFPNLPFSIAGDSGSLVLDMDNNVVGLVVMGEGQNSYAIKAKYIEKNFKITFQ